MNIYNEELVNDINDIREIERECRRHNPNGEFFHHLDYCHRCKVCHDDGHCRRKERNKDDHIRIGFSSV